MIVLIGVFFGNSPWSVCSVHIPLGVTRFHVIKKEVKRPGLVATSGHGAQDVYAWRCQVGIGGPIVREIGKVIILICCRYSHNGRQVGGSRIKRLWSVHVQGTVAGTSRHNDAVVSRRRYGNVQ